MTSPAIQAATTVHLPVAPTCNVQCRYCRRHFDCQRGGPPGVVTEPLTPAQALDYLEAVLAVRKDTASVAVAGPGDPLGNPDKTIETLRQCKNRHPGLLRYIVTNGVMGVDPVQSATQLAELELVRMDIMVNAVDPDILAKLYSSMRLGKRNLGGATAAQTLAQQQAACVKAAVAAGIPVVIRAFAVPGVNDNHLGDVAEAAKAWGAAGMAVIPFTPQDESAMAERPQPNAVQLATIRNTVIPHLPLVDWDHTVRTDPAGILGRQEAAETLMAIKQQAQAANMVTHDRPCVAVTSSDGVHVDVHLGQAAQAVVFELKEHGVVGIKELRDLPPKGAAGGGEARWKELARVLADCRVLLTGSAGDTPRRVLEAAGVIVQAQEGAVEHLVPPLFGILPKKSRKQRGLMA